MKEGRNRETKKTLDLQRMMAKQINGKRIVIPTNGAGTIGQSHAEE